MSSMRPIFLRSGDIDGFIGAMLPRLEALGISPEYRKEYERQAREAYKAGLAGPQPRVR